MAPLSFETYLVQCFHDAYRQGRHQSSLHISQPWQDSAPGPHFDASQRLWTVAKKENQNKQGVIIR